MTDRGSDDVIRQYLRELDEALRTVPADTAREVREGIAEELEALDPKNVRVRVAALGDPVHIAAEVRRGVGLEDAPGAALPTPAASAPRSQRTAGSRPFAVTAALLVAVGSWALPGLGWIAGIVMMWFSPVWRVWEKLVATVAPAAIGAVIALAVAVTAQSTASGADEAPNPLVPDSFLVPWNAAVFALAVAVPVGIWLLVTALRRTRATTDA